MSSNVPPSLISVYSTPLEFDAEIVKAMLAEDDIPSSVQNANAPFPGIVAVPCEVFVALEHEAAARALIEAHEARMAQRAETEEDERETELNDSDSKFV